MENNHKFAIRIVADQSGLSQHVIRIWERRYAAVSPKRTETNRRLYSADDIEKLKLLRIATHSGHHISRVARLPISELKELLAQSGWEQKSKTTAPASVTGSKLLQAAELLQTCLQAVEKFDENELKKTLAHASVVLSVPELLDKLITPFMEKIGENWHKGSYRIAHEHMASAAVKSFLGHLRSTNNSTRQATTAIVATPAGQLHEIGALMAAVTAFSEGWNTVYLGSNLPIQEIAMAALHKNARAILISLVYPFDDSFIIDELQKLDSLVDASTQIILGGQAAQAYASHVAKGRIIFLDTLSALRQHLRALSTSPVLPKQ